MSARKKITDKERLDWLGKNKSAVCGLTWAAVNVPETYQSFYAKTLRAAIDKAMRAPKGAK